MNIIFRRKIGYYLHAISDDDISFHKVQKNLVMVPEFNYEIFI